MSIRCILTLACGVLFALGWCSQSTEVDPVLTAMDFGGYDHLCAPKEITRFDVVSGDSKRLKRSKFKVLAAELAHLAKVGAKMRDKADLLWQSYLTHPLNPSARAPLPKFLEEADVKPELADAWMYLLLKPHWPAWVNGARGVCIQALLRCDTDRCLRVLPEYYLAVTDSATHFEDISNLTYIVFCAAYQYPDDRGWATLRLVANAEEQMLRILLQSKDDPKANAWRSYLARQLTRESDPDMKREIARLLDDK